MLLGRLLQLLITESDSEILLNTIVYISPIWGSSYLKIVFAFYALFTFCITPLLVNKMHPHSIYFSETMVEVEIL